MASTRNDPYANFNFLVEIDGIARAGFQECVGLGAEVEVVEYREGGDQPTTVRKQPGRVHFPNVVLKRGITQDKSLWEWFKQVLNGRVSRASVAITLLDDEGQAVARWTLIRAWPAKWEGPALNGRGNEIAIESLELAHEGLDWVE